jgi:hypothetical protein
VPEASIPLCEKLNPDHKEVKRVDPNIGQDILPHPYPHTDLNHSALLREL